MNYVNLDNSVHSLSNRDKHELYKFTSKLLYKEEFDWTKLKVGDMTTWVVNRFLIEKFFYQDEEYYLWDVGFPVQNGWVPTVESMIHDVVPQGAYAKGIEIYKEKCSTLWRSWQEEKDLKIKAKENEDKAS